MKATLSPELIQQQSFFHIPFWQAPAPDVFQRRAARFRALAQQPNSQWPDYLRLLAEVCDVQQHLYEQLPSLSLSPDDVISMGLADFVIDEYVTELEALFMQMRATLAPRLSLTALRVWQELADLSLSQRQALWRRIVQQQYSLAEQDYVIWMHALLQIMFTRVAAGLSADRVQSASRLGFCPCCGQDAVGAVIVGHGELEGLRYLHCALCNSRWHMVRARCSFCDHDHDLGIQHVEGVEEGALSAAEAECCSSCLAYRKRYRLSKQQYADPVADDLATLALDLLLSEQQWQRGGANPFLLMEKTA